MLKSRIIPSLLHRGGALVKGRRFHPGRVVGSALQAARVFQMRGVDELLVLDIGATPEGRPPDFGLIDQLTSECFMPVAVGGGVRSVDDCRLMMLAGADKVIINTAAYESPDLITMASERFGAQAVVVSIDVKDGEVVTRCGANRTGRDPVEWAQDVQRLGAGEIILCAVERDGTLEGYDRDLIDKVSRAVSIPVVASGGCSGYEDMADILANTQAHAVAAGALFQFCDATPKGAAEYLHAKGIPVRLAA